MKSKLEYSTLTTSRRISNEEQHQKYAISGRRSLNEESCRLGRIHRDIPMLYLVHLSWNATTRRY